MIYYRKRTAEGLKNFIRCEKTVDEKGIFSEKRRQITLREYQSMSKLFS